MTAHLTAGVVTEADVQAARHLVDAFVETTEGPDGGSWLELRGMIAQLAADARTAGYLEGAARGRHDVARLVHDALEGEGL